MIDVIFGLAISIAHDDKGARIADDPWVQEQITAANELFGPVGVRFRWTIETGLPEPHGEMHSRADRDALSKRIEKNVINVFLVRRLEDVDDPGIYRMGVTWTARTDQKRYIVLSREARPSVLAHELGHFFGNQHTKVTNNLMSYSRDSGTIFIDETQKKTIATFAENFLSSRALIDVGPPIRHW